MDFDKNYFKNLLPSRPENSHKGTFGHVLNIAGSGFYSGAAYFSSVAQLRVGCGRSTLASCPTALKAVAAISPDIILLPLDETKEKTISEKAIRKLSNILGNYDVISIGCGLSVNKSTVKFFKKIIQALSKTLTPVVIDADGLNILAQLDKADLPPNTILTPHPLELARLMKVNVENILLQPEFWVKKCSDVYNCTTVLKLHETMVADNRGKFYINKTGNSALSHGGSGDVLCGMIAGFVAWAKLAKPEASATDNLHIGNNRLSCFDACVLGTYLHGVTAELASRDLTEYSVLASDLLNYIPEAIKTII